MSVHHKYGVYCNGDNSEENIPCNDGKAIALSEREYNYQLSRVDSLWQCPGCGGSAEWDDHSEISA